jgi:pyruvate dehydrogenase E1 component beta subunit
MGTEMKNPRAGQPVGQRITLVEAVTLALARALRDDPEVVVFGEDVGVNGGVFRATVGLQAEFGLRRVIDTPLAETLIAGLAVGMSTQGLKPVAEIQFMGFIYAAMEHVISHAARMRNRTRGRLHCPLVIRAPYGGGIHAPEHHSESTEALFAHIPGLRVVVPSSPQRAYGLLLAAIADPDPVLFLEPKRIYRAVRRDVIDDGQALPLDVCFTLREGTDVTLIGWGAMIPECLDAATLLARSGISAEVIDVATLAPMDMATLLASVQKTGRAVIVHEAPHHGGLSAQIAADLSEHALLNLLAPIQRVTGFNTPMPLLQNEHNYLPNSADIVAAAQRTLDFS